MKKMIRFFKGKNFYRCSFMAAAVLISVAVVYAGTTVPYTFSSGTVAKSSEVNANFQELANAMPAAKSTSVESNITALYPNGGQLGSLSVTIPAGGKVIVSASGTLCMDNHSTGSTDSLWLKISKTSGTVFSGSGPYAHYRIDKTTPTYTDGRSCVPFSMSDVFDETTAGTITYYLNGSKDTTSTLTGLAHQVSFTALYVPNSLP